MDTRSFGAVAALAAVLTVGCKGADEDVDPIVVPKAVAFEGKIDAKYTGDWLAVGGLSRLDLKPDGLATIEATTPSASGRSTARLQGKWLAQDGSLLVQYGDAEQGVTTLKYAATFLGAKMVLQQPGGRLKTTYARK